VSARIAYVILAHHRPDLVVRLVRRLATGDARFFVHVDRRAGGELPAVIRQRLPMARLVRRRKCVWGGFGIVRAILEGLDAVHADGDGYDFVAVLSGQDYPVQPVRAIHEYLGERRAQSFLNHFTVPTPRWVRGGLERFTGWHWHGHMLGRHVAFPDPHLLGGWTWHRRFPEGFKPYGGSMYWALSRDAFRYVQDFIARNPRFVRYFKHVNIPDESFFQTILMNSPLAPTIVDDDLHYTDWSAVKSHPKTLGSGDLDAVLGSGKLFARKFDDAGVLGEIDERVHGAGQ